MATLEAPGMTSNAYHFITRWRVEGTREEVRQVLGDPLRLPRWWPAVYLEAKGAPPRTAALCTRGWLPYTLRWQARLVADEGPHGFAIGATGDFNGRGIWTFHPDGRFVDITFDWEIRADKPLLRHLSFLLKPLFAFNHRWAMARGEESLRLELARRRARNAGGLAAVPAPPGPVSWLPAVLLAGAVVLTAAAVAAVRQRRSP